MNQTKDNPAAATSGAQQSAIQHDQYSTITVFPVTVEWDEARGKYTKRPHTGGQSWKNYQAVNGELKKANNLGVVVPAG